MRICEHKNINQCIIIFFDKDSCIQCSRTATSHKGMRTKTSYIQTLNWGIKIAHWYLGGCRRWNSWSGWLGRDWFGCRGTRCKGKKGNLTLKWFRKGGSGRSYRGSKSDSAICGWPLAELFSWLAYVEHYYYYALWLQAFVEKSIEEVRDLEETDFAAEPRDAEAFIKDAIEKVRNLEPSEFSKIFDDVEDETDLLNLRNTSTD